MLVQDRHPRPRESLTLAKTGDDYSGTFTFTAENIKDESAVITVTGSFTDLSMGS